MDRTIGRSARHRRLQLAVLVLLFLALLLLCGMLADIQATSAMSKHTINTPLGIDLPIGATLEQLPPGIRDYIRRIWPELLANPQMTNPELGIDHPNGAIIENLPSGVTDYLRSKP